MSKADLPTPEAVCLIGLDLGTSAIKGVVTDSRGSVLCEATVPTELLRPRPGWVEQDPEDHYNRVCNVLRRLAAAAHPVVALAMAGATGNTLLAKADGTPLGPILNWMDERSAAAPRPALEGLTPAAVAEVTGWPCVTAFPLAHLAWLREHEPERFAEAEHYGMTADWLLHRLTDAWHLDCSSATTCHLQDQERLLWHTPFLDRLGIDPAGLSTLCPSGTALGPLTDRVCQDTGLPASAVVVSGCFDHPAAARACGVLSPGQLLLSCGTSWVGFTPLPTRRAVLGADLLCDPFLAPGGGPWGGIFSVPRIGTTIDWYIAHCIAPGEGEPLRVFNERALEAAPGANGLRLDLREEPRPLDAHPRDISRAVMEGAARLLREKLDDLAVYGITFTEATLVGGPAESPVWPNIVAATTGLSLQYGTRTAGAEGAAMLAGLGAGLYADERAALARRTTARGRKESIPS